jgi:hypothetical protein
MSRSDDLAHEGADEPGAGAATAVPRRPLSALLSHALVAFTIECDNEAERRIPHVTSRYGRTAGATAGPWLTSIVMWFNCMRYVDASPIVVRELERRARVPTNLAGMERWGYITVERERGGTRVARPHWILRATPRGLVAREVWEGLPAEIEQRWRRRLGAGPVERLRAALVGLLDQVERPLPECLPILGHGLLTQIPDIDVPRRGAGGEPPAADAAAQRSLVALLAQALLAFALPFEQRSKVSLAICADALLWLDGPVRVSELPRRTGVSIESIRMATGWLARSGHATLGTDPAAARGRVIAATERGAGAAATARRILGAIEEGWCGRFGSDAVAAVRAALEAIDGPAAAPGSALLAGLEPPPGSWRAARRRPQRLRDYPMVLHRGGYPDGS